MSRRTRGTEQGGSQEPRSHRERTLEQANRFLDEMRGELERAARDGSDIPPRLRLIHERPGHATPEYRTVLIPLPGRGGGSPDMLSGAIARYVEGRDPERLLLALELVRQSDNGEEPVLVAEACDQAGTRLFWMQPYGINGRTVDWGEPLEGGWRDPGDDEMILDAAFQRTR